jgi:hypothetical protein
MTDQHRATPEQWANLEACTRTYPGQWGDCVLELRARVEALEARRPTVQELCQRVEALEAPQHHPRHRDPRAGLVYRVSAANNAPEAIREVAAWLRTGRLLHAAELLEQEADRG